MTSIESTQSKANRVSGLFQDPAADVVFESSDNVHFRTHRKYLDVTTAAFAVPPLISSDDIPVKLRESSEILEILFQFIEPCPESSQYRQPSAMDIEAETFFAIAEAAEKYIVFGAMNTCITRMHHVEIRDLYPIEVLNHCAKHGYADLARTAAHRALSRPLDKIVQGLTHPGLLGKWLLYYNQWLQLARLVQNELTSNDRYQCPRVASIKLKYLTRTLSDISLAGDVVSCSSEVSIACNVPSYCFCSNLNSIVQEDNIPSFDL